MNKTKAKITNIKENEGVALIELENQFGYFESLILDPHLLNGLQIGVSCDVLFKESDVFISLNKPEIGHYNCFESKIIDIKSSKLLSMISLEFGEDNIEALTTSFLCDELELKNRKTITWFIKQSEIMLRMHS